MYNTIQYLAMLYSLYERRLQGIIVVIFIETNINKRWLIQLPSCFPAGASHRVNGYYGIPCNAIQHIYLNRCFDVQSIALYCYESMCCILMSRSMHKQWVKLYFDTAHEIVEQVIYYPNVVVDNYLPAKEGESDSFAWLS